MAPPSTYLFVLLWDSHHAGGVNLVVKNLADAMRRRRLLRPLVGISDWSAGSPRYAGDEVRFRFHWVDRPSALRAVALALRLPALLLGLHRLLRRERVTVVNFQYFSSAAFGVALLKRLRLFRGALVLSFHGTDVRPPHDWYERLAFRQIAGQADALVACSKGIANRMAVEMNINPARITVVYNGVDHTLFHPGAAPAAGAATRPRHRYLISVGSYIARKNHACLLRAFACLSEPELHLYLAGADGPELPALRKLAAELGIAARVHFRLSLVPAEVAQLLAGAAACVQPAWSEGLPLAVLEAAAAGVPLALSNIAGHDEIVSDGLDGRLFDPARPAECARVMRDLLGDPDTARKMAARQLVRSASAFTWDVCLEGYLAAIRRAGHLAA